MLKLKAEMVKKDVSISELSEKLGIHYNTLSKKLNSGEFTLSEMRSIAKILNLSGAEILDIFFDLKVA